MATSNQLSTDTLPVQSMETVMVKSVDLSSMMEPEAFDEHEPNAVIPTSTFLVDDLQMTLRIYPKGDKSGDPKSVSIYVKVKNAKRRDHRKIEFTLRFGAGNTESLSCTQKVLEFSSGSGFGWSPAIPSKTLMEHPAVNIQIRIHYDTSFDYPDIDDIESFEDQNDKLFDICMETGDIRLVVKTLADDDLDGEPPKKRRRLQSAVGIEDGEHVVRMSSAVLRAASPVFHQMLSTEMEEKHLSEITIHAKSERDVMDLLYFCCTNKLRHDSNGLHLIPLAHMYQMHRLFWKCAEKVCKTVTNDTFVETVEVLNKYDIEEGFPLVVEFGEKHIEELKKRDDLSKLSCAFRRVILGVSKENL